MEKLDFCPTSLFQIMTPLTVQAESSPPMIGILGAVKVGTMAGNTLS